MSKPLYVCLDGLGFFVHKAACSRNGALEVATASSTIYRLASASDDAVAAAKLERANDERDAVIARAEKAEANAACYESLVLQALTLKGYASIKTEDAPKLLSRLIERGASAEWEDEAGSCG